MNYSTVTDLKYISDQQDCIECLVHFIGHGPIKFVASKHDTEHHGKEIYYKARSGIFGPVAAYVPPVVEGPGADELAQNIRMQRDSLLIELDSLVSNPFRFAEMSDATKSELSLYRRKLLDITKQVGFPYTVEWPEKPSVISKPTVDSEPLTIIE